MIENIYILFVMDSEFYLLDIWVNYSMKRVCKLLKLFWKLHLVLKNIGSKNDRQDTRRIMSIEIEMITSDGKSND